MSGRVLVVVGAGCIGCRTVKQLLHSGFEVTVLDDLANGRSDPVLTDDFIEGDMSNRELLPGIFRTRNISSVMHFAASIDVGESVRNPAKYCENHVVRTIGQLNSMMQDREIQGSHSKRIYARPEPDPLMEQRELWVRLDAGLCNRLRVLISSIGLAQMSGRKLFVYWPVTRKWKIGPIRLRRAAGRFEATLEDLCTGPFTTVSKARWEAVLASADASKSGHPPDPTVSARVVHLQTIHDFYGVLDRPAHEVARELRPQPALQQRIDAFLKGWTAGDGPTIGIHIRSHQAHEKTEQHSPVSWFERRIGELLADYPSSRFFLSTDAAKVSRHLHERFPGRIREQTTPPGYNTREGIQKGLTDLYILARCDYILGSYWSSFSDMAALLQGERGYEDSQVRKGIDVALIQTVSHG